MIGKQAADLSRQYPLSHSVRSIYDDFS